MKMFCIVTLNIFSVLVFAQDNDPFDVVNIGASILLADDLCRLVNDKNTKIFNDLLVQDEAMDKGWIAYRHKGIWFGFELPNPASDATFQFADIDKDNIKELAVFSRESHYGSGGGTTTFLTTVYKFDTAVWQIMNIENGFSEEMFGREYNNGEHFLHICKQEITVDYGKIRIASISDKGSYDSRRRKSKEKCRGGITPGIYAFRDGRIRWVRK